MNVDEQEQVVNPLKGFKDVKVGGQLVEVGGKGSGNWQFEGAVYMPLQRVAGHTNQYRYFEEDTELIFTIERATPLMMAHNGTIPNPLANLIVSLDKAGKRLQRRKEQKLDTAEVEVELRALLEQQATEDVNMAYSFAIAAVKSIKGLDGREYSGLYDDRDPDAPAATADELPLSLLPAHAINKINALLQTDIDRIMLYFR